MYTLLFKAALLTTCSVLFSACAREAEFQFEVGIAMFCVDSAFSADMKPMVSVRGRLVANDGAVLWKYETTFQKMRDVEMQDDARIRNDPNARTEMLKTALRKACADMMADLTR
jgi:hypothetical protein